MRKYDREQDRTPRNKGFDVMLECKFRVYSFYTLYNLLNMSTKNGSATLPWGSAGNPENPLLSTSKNLKNKKDFPKKRSPLIERHIISLHHPKKT